MKRKAFMAIAAMLLMSPVAFASTIQNVEASSVVAGATCEFSLSHYSDKVIQYADKSCGTKEFHVYLNCAQTEDVWVTVHLSIDGSRVTSTLVLIPAGKRDSGPTSIYGLNDYLNKTYTLTVPKYQN